MKTLLALVMALAVTPGPPEVAPAAQAELNMPVYIEEMEQAYLVPLHYDLPLTNEEFPRELVFEYEVLILHNGGHLTFLDLSHIDYVEFLSPRGMPGFSFNVHYMGPSQLETCYIGTGGLKRTIITSCSGLTPARCIAKHDRMVEAMMTAHPKVKDC